MKKEKTKNDLITEQDYTIQMSTLSTMPEDDSPGDSYSNSGSELMMGLNYAPNESEQIDFIEEVDESNFTDEEPEASKNIFCKFADFADLESLFQRNKITTLPLY